MPKKKFKHIQAIEESKKYIEKEKHFINANLYAISLGYKPPNLIKN
jgi:hypothetical protein